MVFVKLDVKEKEKKKSQQTKEIGNRNPTPF